ncbi:hypothetical protein V8F06_005664 [Rhypophila decipiens]
MLAAHLAATDPPASTIRDTQITPSFANFLCLYSFNLYLFPSFFCQTVVWEVIIIIMAASSCPHRERGLGVFYTCMTFHMLCWFFWFLYRPLDQASFICWAFRVGHWFIYSLVEQS